MTSMPKGRQTHVIANALATAIVFFDEVIEEKRYIRHRDVGDMRKLLAQHNGEKVYLLEAKNRLRVWPQSQEEAMELAKAFVAEINAE